MKFFISICKLIMKITYSIFKLFPVQKNKVLFLSRQSDKLSLDFTLLKNELIKDNQGIKIVSICNRLDDNKSGMMGFGLDTIRSMFHLATSQVCVLDAYWPAVSVLKHKKTLTVIQMWHALGKIKKSGYQTLDRESGRSRSTAKILNMHRNYDIIIAGGKSFNQFYCESFDTTEDKLRNIGLPRIDHLIETVDENRNKFLAEYPELKEKKIILYAPTFRKNIQLHWEPLLEEIDFEKYILIIKGHPNQKIECEHSGVFMCPEFKAIDLLAVCDYLITDYSAIAIEGAILNKKTFYYLYDFEEYTEKNGMNVDLFKAMPGCTFKDCKELIEALDGKPYNQQALDSYREKYLPAKLGTSTASLAKIIIDELSTGKEKK